MYNITVPIYSCVLREYNVNLLLHNGMVYVKQY